MGKGGELPTPRTRLCLHTNDICFLDPSVVVSLRVASSSSSSSVTCPPLSLGLSRWFVCFQPQTAAIGGLVKNKIKRETGSASLLPTSEWEGKKKKGERERRWRGGKGDTTATQLISRELIVKTCATFVSPFEFGFFVSVSPSCCSYLELCCAPLRERIRVFLIF